MVKNQKTNILAYAVKSDDGKKPVDPTSKPTYFPNKSKEVKKQQISLNL